MKRKYFCFMFICIFFIILGCKKSPIYVEREGLLVSGSDNIYIGDYKLERTGIKDEFTAFEFTEPITNLSVGKKKVYSIERRYDVGASKEHRDTIINNLGYMVRIRGVEASVIETKTNYNSYHDIWEVYNSQFWIMSDVTIISVLDTSPSPWPPLGGDGEPPNIDLHD